MRAPAAETSGISKAIDLGLRGRMRVGKRTGARLSVAEGGGDGFVGKLPICDVLVGATIWVESVDQLGGGLVDLLGWSEIVERPLDEITAQALGLDPSSGGRLAVIGEKGSDRGMLRLVEGRRWPRPEGLLGEAVEPTFPLDAGGRPGFARGWSGVELVVEDVDELYRQIRERHVFAIMKEPFTVDLTAVGSNLHRAFVMRVTPAFYMAFTMALTQPDDREFPAGTSPVGPIFAVHCRTDDHDRFLRHYQGELGFRSFLEMEMTEGFLHDLWGLDSGVGTTLCLIKGDGEGTGHGSIEVQGYPRGFLVVPDERPGRILSVTYSAAVATPDLPRPGKGIRTEVGPEGELLEVVPHSWRSSSQSARPTR